uniref:UDP-glycosyltransferases domain-containing protein n=1 Tax=Fagus sylvatica TaxID=28930 RepID=A0A2N9GEV6_FAGSY
MKQSFEDVLRHMIHDGCNPICVISDFFLGWTLESCRSFNIPRIVFHGMGVISMVVCKSPPLHVPSIKDLSLLNPIEFSELTNIPFTLKKCDILEGLLDSDPNDPTLGILLELGEADVNSGGVIFNSFEEIEGDYMAALESFYCNEGKAYCVGSALLYDDQVDAEDHQSYSYIKWLDNQVGLSGVIYVSFGTQTHLSNDQMDEIAFGLERAGHPFIWAVRSSSWAPPNGWNERVKDKRVGAGLMVPQRGVGGEKIMTVNRGVICERVKELMGGQKGRKVKERAQELGKMARHAVEKGGSCKKLDELIERLSNKNM